MSGTEQVNPLDLREGDLIDLTPLLTDPAAHKWVWQPFGVNERLRREAVNSARLVAECELAVVDCAESGEGDAVLIYTDQINLAVTRTHPITRKVN